MADVTLKNFFPSIDKYAQEHLDLINSSLKRVTTKRNEILLNKGDIAKDLYLVVKGCLRVFAIDDQANESTRYLILEGQFGTSFPSFILHQPSNVIVQSVGAAQIFALSYEKRELLLQSLPNWETESRKRIELDYIDSIFRLEGLISLNARERFSQLMKNRPDIILSLPSRIVADYLGISKETLSRLKRGSPLSPAKPPLL